MDLPACEFGLMRYYLVNVKRMDSQQCFAIQFRDYQNEIGKYVMNLKSKIVLVLCMMLSAITAFAQQEMWNGLVVERENRCAPYNKKEQYPYPQSVEDTIVANMGGRVYGPYTGRYYINDSKTDIEHIVAASEGHDSGLCSASSEMREQFAQDPLNLTLAAPAVNRCGATGKCGLDAADWMPEKNKCWFANRIVQIKAKYGLSVNRAEADSLAAVLSECESTSMVFHPRKAKVMSRHVRVETAGGNGHETPLDMYDTNGNGRITCSEARSHGIAPVSSESPAYEYMYDRDNDGVVCE